MVAFPSGGWYQLSGPATVTPLLTTPNIQTTALFGSVPVEVIQAGFFSEMSPIPLPGISAGLYFLEENDVLTSLDDSGAISDLESRMATVEAWMAQTKAAAAMANGGA